MVLQCDALALTQLAVQESGELLALPLPLRGGGFVTVVHAACSLLVARLTYMPLAKTT
jgi:hypothetical protein